jgi:hypothetical protein
MVQKPARLTSRLDVRLYPKQRRKLDRFCEINKISVGQLVRNLVESLKVDENNLSEKWIVSRPYSRVCSTKDNLRKPARFQEVLSYEY